MPIESQHRKGNQKMIIIDGHLDLSWNALQGNRNLLQSVEKTRKAEGKSKNTTTVALPEMKKANIAIAFATLFARSTGIPSPNVDYGSVAQASGIVEGQLGYYRALEREGHVIIIEGIELLQTHLQQWKKWEEKQIGLSPPLGLIISMEGADPISGADQLEYWVKKGLKLIGLSHYGIGRYGGGTGTEEGLSPLALPLLTEMSRLGVILDLTHTSDTSFWQALEHYSGLVIASHNNCRTLVPNQRQFSDQQLTAIFERDGVIGTAFDAWMLAPEWDKKKPDNSTITLETVANHIDHICQLAGNSYHAAIGTDLDGGFGREQSPSDVDSIADLPKLTAILERRGYSFADITSIMYGNWYRVLESTWK